MRAALCRRYGPPARVTLEEVPSPVPGPGEVLVAIQAAGLTTGDARIRGARAPGGMGPVIRQAARPFLCLPRLSRSAERRNRAGAGDAVVDHSPRRRAVIPRDAGPPQVEA